MAGTEARLKAQGFRSRIHVRATRGHPLSKAKAAANRAKSRIRARIEHVFDAQETAPGGRLVRTIGIVRAHLIGRIDVVELGSLDERIEGGGAAAAFVRGGLIVPGFRRRKSQSPIRFIR